jgi:hypothetical protein
MSSKTLAIVRVPSRHAHDDGSRFVVLSQLLPHNNHPTEQTRRAQHAARMYRNGLRWFRYGAADGPSFCVQTLDAVQGIAAGHRIKRKTVQIVKLYELYPESR